MDIISEILETDKLAEDKIRDAYKQQQDIEQKTTDEISQLDKQLSEKTERYREKALCKCNDEIDKQTQKLIKEENERKDKIDELYRTKHKEWEKTITERIISGR